AELMQPSSCPQTQSAIWGRAGAVIDSKDGRIFIATGNGDWNGTTDWGDAVIELDSGATQVLGNYTPSNTADLNDDDLDLGSTSPVLLDGNLLAQGGKDGKIRLLDRQELAGTRAHRGQRGRSLPHPVVPTYSPSRQCGGTAMRPGCSRRTTAVPRPGGSRVECSVRY